MIIFRFPGQPRGFRGARSKKPLKKSQNLPKMTRFSMVFVSSCFKTTWLTLKPTNQHSVVPSDRFDTQFVPGTASIVEISLNLSVFWQFSDHSASWRIFFTSYIMGQQIPWLLTHTRHKSNSFHACFKVFFETQNFSFGKKWGQISHSARPYSLLTFETLSKAWKIRKDPDHKFLSYL